MLVRNQLIDQLDIDFAALKRGAQQYLLLGAGVGLLLVAELIAILFLWKNGQVAVPAVDRPTSDS